MKTIIKSIILFVLLQGNINIASAQHSQYLMDKCMKALNAGLKQEEVKECQQFHLYHYEFPRIQKELRNIHDQDLILTLLPCQYKNCIEHPHIYPWIMQSLVAGDPQPQPSREADLLIQESIIELRDTFNYLSEELDIRIKEFEKQQ